MNEIFTRKSTRVFRDEKVPEEKIRKILQAGMAGPTAVNARDWFFIVIRERENLLRVAEANGPRANPLKGADFGVLLCGDLERAPAASDIFVVDCAIAGQNMLLEAESLGVGGVWLGTWPNKDRMEAQRKLFSLPETVVPHSVFAFGYPGEGDVTLRPGRGPKPEWEEDRVHWEKW